MAASLTPRRAATLVVAGIVVVLALVMPVRAVVTLLASGPQPDVGMQEDEDVAPCCSCAGVHLPRPSRRGRDEAIPRGADDRGARVGAPAVPGRACDRRNIAPSSGVVSDSAVPRRAGAERGSVARRIELAALGYMATPVTVINDDVVIVGFDQKRLEAVVG